MKIARLVLLALLFVWASIARADVAIPQLTGRVVDQTGTLTSSDIAQLTQTLKNLEMRKGSQVAVLIVPTTARNHRAVLDPRRRGLEDRPQEGR